MERAFTRGEQRCGHYDEAQLPHGGPAERKDCDGNLLFHLFIIHKK